MVLVTASVTPGVPEWFGDRRRGGWVTADYVMLPGSTPRRKQWPDFGHTDSRGTEIQRLIGRSIRAALDLSRIGRHTISLDCQVLQADGGTRTASICAAFVALRDALLRLPAECPDPLETELYNPRGAILDGVTAVSVGLLEGRAIVDLDYREDAAASVDLNVVMNDSGGLVEVQGCAEGAAGYSRDDLNRMLDLAGGACAEIRRLRG
jgi:ribonuclease PH